MATNEFVDALAQTCVTLFLDGATDVSADDIAAVHYTDGVPQHGRAIVRLRLLAIRDVLLEDHSLPVCPLGSTFFHLLQR